MRLKRLQTENFRALRQVDMDLESLTALLGRNGAGKSSMLAALSQLYSPNAQVTEYDYFNKDMSLTIRIRAFFDSLTDAELTEFGSYVHDRELVVTKQITAGGAIYIGSRLQFPAFAEIRTSTGRELTSRYNDLVRSGEHPQLTQTARSQAQATDFMEEFEAQNRDRLEPIESPTQFFGPSSVGGGKLDNHTRFVYVPAVRDAASELQRGGAIVQLIDVLVRRTVESRKDVKEAQEAIEKMLTEVYSRENLTELDSLAELITRILARYAPGSGVFLDFSEIKIPKVSLPSPTAALIEDNFTCPINYAGHGLQRALIMALLELLAMSEESAATGDSDPESNNGADAHDDEKRTPLDVILAIEEPELYLHPARSRDLCATLVKLSKTERTETNGKFQIVLTTHSPFFVDLRSFSGVRVARKVPAEGTDISETQIQSYQLLQAAQELANAYNANPDDYTEDSFIAHSSGVLTPLVNEGFFADVAVVVEGMSEVGALSALQHLQGLDWERRGVVIVPAMGKPSLDRPFVVFRGLNIPVYMLIDSDAESKNQDQTIQLNRALMRLLGEEPVDFPGRQIKPNWASFETDLEEVYKEAAGEDWVELRDQVANALGYPDANRVLKTAEGAFQIVHTVYKRGQSLPFLEEVVARITELAPG